ncbi:MAG: type I polyketide synthase [Cyanobacteria bacterium J06627_28]
MKPIAVVGIGCRFPQANSPQAYWRLLIEGWQAITDVPSDRWRASDYYHPDPSERGKMNSCKGGFLTDIDCFDANFFGIGEQEAQHIDPQQRLFLEVAWEALEQAGISPLSLRGSATGVFTGLCTVDYHRLLYRNFEHIGAHSGTGTTMSITANRLSYLLDLQGPSMAIDAACASSAVAVHLACQSLQTEESNLCIVGGVNLILSPDSMISSAKTGLLSAQGACRPFDANADGYVRGEGCGVVILKRLADAVDAKDNILAIIRGSAVNQDGLSNSLTAPNGRAQQALIQQALNKSGVCAKDIDYVEAHAVGTPIGDAIEFKALEKIFSGERESPCLLGSAKSNLGHLEAASGMAALIKLILSLQHETIPPQLNFEQANALIDVDASPFELVPFARPWPRKDKARLAGMSTFGFGGTNAHIIVEEAPRNTLVPQPCSSASAQGKKTAVHTIQDRSHHLLVLTAKSQTALRTLASRYQRFIADHILEAQTWQEQNESAALSHTQALLSDICFTASNGRSHFSERLCCVSDSLENLRRQLAQFSEGEEMLLASQFIAGRASRRKRARVFFHFPEPTVGTLRLGEVLYETQSTFREIFDECAQRSVQYFERKLTPTLQFINNSSDMLETSTVEQATGFVVTYALARMWYQFGVAPNGVLGEGLGNYAAACAIGLMTLEEALELIASAASSRSDLSIASLLAKGRSQKPFSQKLLTGSEVILPMGADRPLAMYRTAEPVERLYIRQLQSQGHELFLSADVGVWPQILSHLGQLFVSGVSVNWKKFDEGYQRRRIPLPTYPFERSRHWFTEPAANDTHAGNVVSFPQDRLTHSVGSS